MGAGKRLGCDKMKADGKMKDTDGKEMDGSTTNFDYLFAKVQALQNELEVVQKVLSHNELSYKETHKADAEIEDDTWELV